MSDAENSESHKGPRDEGGDITLHEAIKKLLIETNRPMKPTEIANELNQRDWYKRKDAGPLPSSQISARVSNYASIFFKRDGMVHLMGWADSPADNTQDTDDDDGPLKGEWLTPQQIAKKLQVNQQSVRNWLLHGQIQGAKFGDVWRVHRRALEKFIRVSVSRGQQNYDPGPEVKNLVRKMGYKFLTRIGSRDQAILYIDVGDSQNEVELISGICHDEQGRRTLAYEGFARLEDSPENPYEELYVTGTSNVDVFLKLIEKLPAFNLDVNPIIIDDDD